MKRLTALALAAIIALPANIAMAAIDDRIFTDTVQDTYTGRSIASEYVNNLNFSDVGPSHWAMESITRSGSLNMVKGSGNTYQPQNAVTNQEALAFIVRMMGYETEALDAANRLKETMNTSSQLYNLWSLGYIYMAMSLGVIDYEEYTQLTSETGGGRENYLVRTAPVTRERIAHWLAKGLNTMLPGTIYLYGEKQAIYGFKDMNNISSDYAAAVDAIAEKGIMSGDAAGNFNPKSSLTRAEMAQLLSNMGDIYYAVNNIERKTGTVGGFRDNQQQATGEASIWREYYIRTASGGVDRIQYQSDQAGNSQDVVVFKNGQVTGLLSLQEGDQIEYLVDKGAMDALYIQVTNSVFVERVVEGKLYEVNFDKGNIVIQDPSQKTYVYNLMDGLYDEEPEKENTPAKKYLVIDQKRQYSGNLPIGSVVRLNLRNDVVDSINFVGTQTLVSETRGIVTENNTEFGYLTFIDNNGREQTKSYYADSIKVEKQQYYDMEDEIGYWDEVFPNFEYDPRDTDITEIEPGDIIFVRYDPADANLIVNLSASTNYVAMYGRIAEITRGDGLTRYLVEFENKQTSWFDAANGIYVSRDGVPINSMSVNVGDWAKILVNQAIITPGYIMESVKEISLEGSQQKISGIIKGQVAGIDFMQKELMVQNAETFAKAGWSNYQALKKFSLNSNDIEYYYEDQRISLDYVERFLKRSEGDVYLAVENSGSGERVKKVTFRMGRDQLLDPDTVISADGNGSFAVISNSGSIATDKGTIVIRNGRLVTGNNIMALDYAAIALNGANKAAVVEITDAPDISNIMIGRGRILSVDDGKSFKVQSMAVLSGNEWVYTPVQREFTIDYNTRFLNADGFVDRAAFLDYTESSVVDKVYNIVYDGSRATYVVEAPYPNNAVRGTVYSTEAGGVSIKNVQYYESSTGKWLDISRSNSTLTITVPENCIIAKNNQITSLSRLAAGDQVRIMTGTLPTDLSGGAEITGYIVLTEK